MKTALVFGATGLVGSYVVKLLLENEALRCELAFLKKLQALIQAEETAKKRKP